MTQLDDTPGRTLDATLEARVDGTVDGTPAAGRDGGGPGIDHVAMSEVLARFAQVLVGRYGLDEVMDNLGADISGILGVAGAGVMLGDPQGHLRFVTTSDAALDTLESLQIELDEGPCLLAFRTGERVASDDLRLDGRFPMFGPMAVEAGMIAVHSFPMTLDDTRIGALNLYSEEPRYLSPSQVAAGETFADTATAYLIHARDLQQRDVYTQDLQRALSSRVVVEQAKGFVAASLGTAVPNAFELIRSHARRHRQKIQVIARAVVNGDLLPHELAEQ